MRRLEGARGANTGSTCSTVNDSSHGWTGHVPRNRGNVMAQPKVHAIYWDETYFHAGSNPGPAAVDLMNQFFKDILTSDYFMRALQQYGVGLGHFLNYTVIPPDQVNPPRGTELTDEDIEQYLTEW